MEFLRDEFDRRKKKNSRYSLRAFALLLGIPSGRLSEILSGKRRVTRANLGKICRALRLSLTETESILKAYDVEKSSGKISFVPEKKILGNNMGQLLESWIPYAILSLIKTKKFNSDHKVIAERLGITFEQAKNTFDVLVRDQLIVERRGRYYENFNGLTTMDGISSQVKRDFHKIHMRKFEAEIDEIPVDKRKTLSLTVAVNPAKLEAAFEILNTTLSKVEKTVEDRQSTEVYCLNIYMYPLTKS